MLSHLDYCRLVVFDPLSAYFRQHESSRTQETREVFDMLTEIAARQEVAIIGTTQQSRSQRGPDVSRLSTSVKLAATARAIWTIKTDSTTPGRRLLKPTKNNLAPDTNYLAFTIQPAASNRELGHIVWEHAEATADAATSRQTRLAKSSDAGRWLLIKLANGPVTSCQLKQDGNLDGFSWIALNRTKAQLGIEAHLMPDPISLTDRWHWQLPNHATTETPPQTHIPVAQPKSAHTTDRVVE